MKRLVMKPDGWPCTLAECRPGHFVYRDSLCFKCEYSQEDGGIEVFNEAGEYFWGGVQKEEERRNLIVQPVKPSWETASCE